jgi:UDP-GlcNAc:undecaprenyl-phosphate/decaprenyl-phosphate GlcNAc-1-phosphate transferase
LTPTAPLILVAAALASIILTPLVIRVAVGRELYDIPDAIRRIHTRPVPRLGGVSVFVATALGLLAAPLSGMGTELSPERHQFFLSILLGGGILFATGLIDDLRGLRPAAKLAGQCLAAVVVYLYGQQIEVVNLGPIATVSLGWLSLPVTILWIVGVTNAFNLIDGVDGLATGIGLVALVTVMVAALILGNTDVALVCVALSGALLGFLLYNFNPARIFLGDSGSLFVGFMLAVLSVHGSLKSATAVLVAVPLFALAVPLLELSLSVARRWLRGVPIFSADTRHIFHRLLASGLTQPRVVLVMSLVSGTFALLGLLLAFAPPPALRGIALIGGAVVLLLLTKGMHRLNYPEFVESRAALAFEARRIRRIIHHQIYARELAQQILGAESMEEISYILQGNAAVFGFQRMVVARESELDDDRCAGASRRAPHGWKLDYEIMGPDYDDDPYILRICCVSGSLRGACPDGAERVARIMGPAVEEWLVKCPAKEPAPLRNPTVKGIMASRVPVGAV